MKAGYNMAKKVDNFETISTSIKMKDVYFSFNGRITRKTFWIEMFSLLFIIIMINILDVFCLVFIRDNNIKIDKLSVFIDCSIFLLQIIYAYVLLAISIKRCHDIGRSAWCVININILSVIIYGIASSNVFSHTVNMILNLIVCLLAICLFMYLGVVKGSDGINAYGKKPI